MPQDEGRHSLATGGGLSPLEWWYIVSRLNGDNGRRYFLFLCWFSTNTFQLGVTEFETGRRWTFARRFDPSQASSATGRLDLNYGGNRFYNTEPFAYRTVAAVPGVKLKIDYYSTRPPFPVGRENGRAGFFHYPHGGYTWYYTMGRLRAEGLLSLDGNPIAVKGYSWLDRQWGAFAPMTDWRWEWMGLQLKLAPGDYPRPGPWEINCWNLRDASTGELVWTMATALYPDNSVHVGTVRMEALGYWTSPNGRTYSHGWRVTPVFCRTLPLRLLVLPVVDDQTQPTAARLRVLFPATRPEFWEGACEVRLDRPVGWGVTELTMHYTQRTFPSPPSPSRRARGDKI